MNYLDRKSINGLEPYFIPNAPNIYIHRTVFSPLTEYTLFSTINGTFSRKDYKINHKVLETIGRLK